jgi:hypothetical protein
MSDDGTEYTEAGIPIHRHKARERAFEPAIAHEENLEKIDEHIRRHIGEVAAVYHEIISDLVHIDVHLVEPSPMRQYFTLITSGMSDRPMRHPDGFEEFKYAELMMSLPADWPVHVEGFWEGKFEKEKFYWPVRWLKELARFPHEYQTWLWASHTVPNGDPPQAYASNTKLCCALLMNPVLVPDEFHHLDMGAGKVIHFLSMLPIYKEEMDYKLKQGLDPLLERLENAQVTELLNIKRKNVCKKGLFGLG